VSARHRLQQESLAAALARRFASNPRVQYVAVAGNADLANRKLTSDGVNLNAAGYEAVADRIVDPVFDAVHQMTSTR
jgi:lysophospholipase L1-like esterase